MRQTMTHPQRSNRDGLKRLLCWVQVRIPVLLCCISHTDAFATKTLGPQSKGRLRAWMTTRTTSPGFNTTTSDESSRPERQSSLEPTKTNRRSFVTSLLTVGYTNTASAMDSFITTSTNFESDFDNKLQCCPMDDLPPIPDDCVRVFLCRHGQTENNRLHLIQGARVDPPLNQNGIVMAQRLGSRLAQLTTSHPISTVFHSPLVRSVQTAQLAAQQLRLEQNGNKALPVVRTRTIPSLSEVDFGPVAEGRPAREVRTDMAIVYAAWASGNLDVRFTDGGESASEVFQRVGHSLWDLVHAAQLDPTRQVAAISHSTFQRMLLATILNTSLAQAALLEQVNCCINVLDLHKHDTLQLGPKSKPFGGFLSRAGSDFHLNVPKGTVVRMNEKCHLDGIQI